MVATIIAAHGLDPETPVSLPDGGEAPLKTALQTAYEVRNLLGITPEKSPAATDFVSGLRKLQPRLYSIASSPKAHPDEVHLCVGAVRYEKDGVAHKGVCSTFLADRLEVGATTGVFVHTAKHFRVPADAPSR
nr:hypothetical protein [Verrucomicrobium spinosum]